LQSIYQTQVMCGICGIINLKNNPVSEEQLRSMMKVMKHRGPDDEGVLIKDNIALGFVRLSIIDLSYAGHQPMFSNDGHYAIIFNGEIYNYIELKEILKCNYSFRSNTDSEVLLAAYIRWGKNCLERLNGMFAFVILDTISMEIFGARDRFGIKPFYYTINNFNFIFASDIPSILTVLTDKPESNDSIIYDFMVYNRNDHNNQTFFKGIYKLQQGHQFQIVNNKLTINNWYRLEERVKNNISIYTSKLFVQDFSNSIKLQLRSDVPIGTCLSGGLDSSSITSMMQLNSSNPKLHAFSAVYGKGVQGDESDYIELYNKTRLNIHYAYPSSISLVNDMEHFQKAICEPLPNTSEYAEFKVMELAKKHCTVILNGQGADEIMAGYHYFFGYYFRDLLKQYKVFNLTTELFKYFSIHKSLLGLKSLSFAMHPKWFKNLNTSSLNQEFINMFSKNPNPIIDDFYTSANLQEFLIKHFKYKFEHNLLWADKSGMYFSLETRFPFLDHQLVEKTLASGITIQNGYTKFLLRDAMTGIVPDKIRNRVDKIGFQTPEKEWFKNTYFKEYFLDITHSGSFQSRLFFDKSKCQKVLDNFQKSGKYHREFWKWLSLELWMRKYID
jgi:asparagine synthase (glutamine-hydrolysing)